MMSRSSTHFTSMTEQEKGKITDQRDSLIKLNEGLAVGRYKTIYQVKDEYNMCIMRDFQAEVYNVFGIKQEDASLFVMDVLRQIQSNVEILLSRKTYADTALRNIGATQLPLLESRSSYWTIEVNVEKQTPFAKLMNIKDGKEQNGMNCWVKELHLFARFINSKMPTVDKGLVIFNPAVGEWSTCEGGQNVLKTCLRGDQKVYILFEGG